VVSDPYRWLEDQNSPETRAWIDTQNACTQSLLKTLPGSDAIAKRLGELIKVDTIRLPSERGGRYFYSKRAAGQDLFVLYMRRGTGPEEMLMDPASLSADHTTSVNFEGLSDDGKLVAYGVRKGGEDEVSIHFIDTDTRKDISDSLPRARYISGASFKTDKSGFYYSKLTDDGPRAYYHAMGTDAEQDKKIFGDGFASDKILVVGVSEDGRYLLLTVLYGSACEKSEIIFRISREADPSLHRQKPLTPASKEKSRATRCTCKRTGRPRSGAYCPFRLPARRRRIGRKLFPRTIRDWKVFAWWAENHRPVFSQRSFGTESF